MATVSTASLVESLRDFRVLEPAQLQEIASFQDRFLDAKALARELIHRTWLTAYQANQLLQGRGRDLLLGSHVLMEKLGEGGMGQVFKARNWKLGRVVALKLIRKEKLNNVNAVARFQREVRAVAQLNHPNVVRAYDADEVDGSHLLVMEFVDRAADLAKLVRTGGPLPVAKACEYIRQAVLGLQHAHEQGLVHRDIKPHNLLLTRDGTVKLLDMGLARLNLPAVAHEKSTFMTQEGAFMGTPDYVAPEQALNPHTADIRADIYSLGCTFYFLLTGRPPFPTGSLTEKLLQHQFDEPPALEHQRADVSPAVSAVLRKMMAKKAENRYPTPADVAVALAAVLDPQLPSKQAAAQRCEAISPGEPTADTMNSALKYMAQNADGENGPPTPSIGLPDGRRRWRLYGVGGGVAALALATAMLLFPPRQQPGTDRKQIVPDAPQKLVPPWTVLHAETLHSTGGTTLAKQADGSILASGAHPSPDTYTITARSMVKNITGIRLELLSDPSLPAQGPGRANSGNFVLSEFTLAIARAGQAVEKAEPVPLQKPLATFSQLGYSIAAAIDSNPQTGWAILPRLGRDHTAVFELKSKIANVDGGLLVFTFEHHYAGSPHGVGKLRLSVTSREPPILPYADVPPTEDEAFLSDLEEVDLRAPNNWFGKNGCLVTTGQHHAIWVNDQPSPKGLFLHPPTNGFSCVGYELKGRYRRFRATAAINDSGKSATPLTFAVWGDGKTLWKSRPLQQPGETDDCNVDVSGLRRLDLEVDCPGPSSYAHAVWVEPRLLKSVSKR
jgi:serine/threonine protein kinase